MVAITFSRLFLAILAASASLVAAENTFSPHQRRALSSGSLDHGSNLGGRQNARRTRKRETLHKRQDDLTAQEILSALSINATSSSTQASTTEERASSTVTLARTDSNTSSAATESPNDVQDAAPTPASSSSRTSSSSSSTAAPVQSSDPVEEKPSSTSQTPVFTMPVVVSSVDVPISITRSTSDAVVPAATSSQDNHNEEDNNSSEAVNPVTRSSANQPAATSTPEENPTTSQSSTRSTADEEKPTSSPIVISIDIPSEEGSSSSRSTRTTPVNTVPSPTPVPENTSAETPDVVTRSSRSSVDDEDPAITTRTTSIAILPTSISIPDLTSTLPSRTTSKVDDSPSSVADSRPDATMSTTDEEPATTRPPRTTSIDSLPSSLSIPGLSLPPLAPTSSTDDTDESSTRAARPTTTRDEETTRPAATDDNATTRDVLSSIFNEPSSVLSSVLARPTSNKPEQPESSRSGIETTASPTSVTSSVLPRPTSDKPEEPEAGTTVTGSASSRPVQETTRPVSSDENNTPSGTISASGTVVAPGVPSSSRATENTSARSSQGESSRPVSSPVFVSGASSATGGVSTTARPSSAVPTQSGQETNAPSSPVGSQSQPGAISSTRASIPAGSQAASSVQGQQSSTDRQSSVQQGASSVTSVTRSGASGTYVLPTAVPSIVGNATASASRYSASSIIASNSVTFSSAPAATISSSATDGMDELSSASSSRASSSRSSDSANYDFVPTSSLFLALPTSTREPTTTSVVTSVSESVSLAERPITTITARISFPSDLPAKIVPVGAPTQAPEGSSLISILFDDGLPWSFVSTNESSAGQILLYMPPLLSQALDIDQSQIVNNALMGYQSTDFSSADSSVVLTVWTGYVPSDKVDQLSAYLSTPTSPLYAQGGMPAQLAMQINPSLPLEAFGTNDGNNGTFSSAKSDGNGNKTTIIAVVASFGSVIVLLTAFLGFRYIRRQKGSAANDSVPPMRQLRLGDPNSPIQGSHASRFSGSQRAGRPDSSYSDASSGSGHSSAHSMSSENHGGRAGDRTVSWYSGRYMSEIGSDEDHTSSPRHTSYSPSRADIDNPFADRRFSAYSDMAARSEGVRKVKTGAVSISRPQFEGSSLML